MTEPGSEQQKDLNEIINKACDPASTRRYRIAQELGDDLAKVQRGERPGPPLWKKRLLPFSKVLGGVLLICAVGKLKPNPRW